MFDIGFIEMLAVAIIALLVLGPERLPVAVRTVGLTLGRLKRSFSEVKQQIEKEVGADEIRQQLHNEKILANLSKQGSSETTSPAAKTAAKAGSNVRKRSTATNTDAAVADAPPAKEPEQSDPVVADTVARDTNEKQG